jgi:hypothetical protein
MRDIKERLSVLWIFALLNYLYADVIALWAILGSPPADTPHLGQLALAGSAVLMEIPIAMILASRLLPLRANRLANIIAGSIVTLVNGFLTFIPPLVGWGRPPALPEYLWAILGSPPADTPSRSTCSSQRSKQSAPWPSSGRRGPGQGRMPRSLRN